MNAYLVTGCAGFIGSHLVEALLVRGERVVGVDAFTDYYPRAAKESNLATAREHPRFSLVEGNLAEISLPRLLRRTSGVFHLAAQPGVRSSFGARFGDYLERNVLATQMLFEAAAEAGTRVVFASSSSIYGNAESYPTPEETPAEPVSPYGMTKLACEHLARVYSNAFGLDFVGLRYFTVYGPRQRPDMALARIAAAVVERLPFHVYGNGDQTRDFTYVGDVVAATLAVMESASHSTIYNVGGGTQTSLREVISAVERLSARSLDVRYQAAAAGDIVRTAADTTRIERDVGWKPKTSLEEGLLAQLRFAGVLSA
jgi:UDP-glucuronate 4-epimerase